jgi:hypothetical protein
MQDLFQGKYAFCISQFFRVKEGSDRRGRLASSLLGAFGPRFRSGRKYNPNQIMLWPTKPPPVSRSQCKNALTLKLGKIKVMASYLFLPHNGTTNQWQKVGQENASMTHAR